MHQHRLNNQSFIDMIMQSQDSFVLSRYWPIWITCSFPILTTLQGVPAVVTWLAREYACVCCIIELQKECWHGIGEAVGSWERPLCLLVHQGTEASHCESGQCWVSVLSTIFPPPFRSPAQSRTREGGRKWLFIDGTCTGTQWRGESVSWLQLPFMILSHSPATWMNATEWLITSTNSMKDQSECTQWWQVYCYGVTYLGQTSRSSMSGKEVALAAG